MILPVISSWKSRPAAKAFRGRCWALPHPEWFCSTWRGAPASREEMPKRPDGLPSSCTCAVSPANPVCRQGQALVTAHSHAEPRAGRAQCPPPLPHPWLLALTQTRHPQGGSRLLYVPRPANLAMPGLDPAPWVGWGPPRDTGDRKAGTVLCASGPEGPGSAGEEGPTVTAGPWTRMDTGAEKRCRGSQVLRAFPLKGGDGPSPHLPSGPSGWRLFSVVPLF